LPPIRDSRRKPTICSSVNGEGQPPHLLFLKSFINFNTGRFLRQESISSADPTVGGLDSFDGNENGNNFAEKDKTPDYKFLEFRLTMGISQNSPSVIYRGSHYTLQYSHTFGHLRLKVSNSRELGFDLALVQA